VLALGNGNSSLGIIYSSEGAVAGKLN
jgi:hypothetical protein